MGTVTVSLPADGSTGTVSQYNTPLTTVVNEFNGNIDNNNIKSGAAIATSKLATDNGIGATHLSASAIKLGYAFITSNFDTAATSAAAVTGLTTNVTIPVGGRSIKITVNCRALFNTTNSTTVFITIWDGTVGTGTQIGSGVGFSSTGATGGLAMAVVTPAPGAKTYNVGLHTAGTGTARIEGGATYPAFILVEAI